MVPPFENLEGVINVVSGYTGGYLDNPSYEKVCSGHSGHYEAVQVTYDPGKITYTQLLEVFWQQIDPTDEGGQFFDRGSSYKTAIFYHNDEQNQKAKTSKKSLEESRRFDRPMSQGTVPLTHN